MISDQTYLNWHNKLSASPAFKAFWLFAGLYAIIFYEVVGLYALAFANGWKVVLLATFVALFTRYVVCEIIILFYKKRHPYQRLNFQPPISWLFSFADQQADSFPSQHAAACASIATIFFLFSPILGWFSVLIALLACLGRMVLGYHDVWDILGGLIIGGLTGLIIAHWFLPLFTH